MSSFLLQAAGSLCCFWETQPRGCMRVGCAFHHSKPRHINGLFLPPTRSESLLGGARALKLKPFHPLLVASPRSQENTFLPSHPPVIINLSDEEEEEEEEEEESSLSPWVPKTAEDIEEEKAIREICRKSGEYYGIQHLSEHPAPTPVSSPSGKGLSALETTEQDPERGDGSTAPPRVHNPRRGGESSGRKEPVECVPRTNHRSFENGEAKLVKNCHHKEARKKWIAQEPRQSPSRAGKDKYTSGSYSAATWRKRNPHAKVFSKFKTTAQSREDLEVDRKGEQKEVKGVLQFTRRTQPERGK
ncbi:uncharacterized protein C12orf50 homolog [Melanerpes formicivorus]|uniref:uncharacterized protein C12orf50 homolog n=1 Tax=Melanerpes formicivorus TaxID=211600 RepID=UPI00358F4751